MSGKVHKQTRLKNLQTEPGGKQPFMRRALDRLSVPFVALGFYAVEKILLDIIIQVERAKKDGNPEIRYLNLDKHFRSKD